MTFFINLIQSATGQPGKVIKKDGYGVVGFFISKILISDFRFSEFSTGIGY